MITSIYNDTISGEFLIVPFDFTDPAKMKMYFNNDIVIEGYYKQTYNGITIGRFIKVPMDRAIENKYAYNNSNIPVITGKIKLTKIEMNDLIEYYIKDKINDLKTKHR